MDIFDLIIPLMPPKGGTHAQGWYKSAGSICVFNMNVDPAFQQDER